MSGTGEAADPAAVVEAMGFRPLSLAWAKSEILLGLLAAGSGLALAGRAPVEPWGLTAGGVALFVLGGYLAMAGHRSHLYQSNNRQVAFLAARLQAIERRLQKADEP